MLNKFWESANKEDIKGIKLSVGIAGSKDNPAPAPQEAAPSFSII
jgi:hypothetical protein